MKIANIQKGNGESGEQILIIDADEGAEIVFAIEFASKANRRKKKLAALCKQMMTEVAVTYWK